MTDSIVKKTLILTGALVGALVAFMGTVTAVTLLVASHAVGTSGNDGGAASTIVPASKVPAAAAPSANAKQNRGAKPPSGT